MSLNRLYWIRLTMSYDLEEGELDLAIKQTIREECERSLLFFIRYFFKKQNGFSFEVNDHHVKIIEALERCYNHECNRLIINIPPRYGKTEIAVIGFVSWCIAKDPSNKFIHLSYSTDLALDNSSRIKELISSDEFQDLWPSPLKSDSKSKKKWYTSEKGGLYATSTGGPVTGFGAGCVQRNKFGGALIIDDPLKPDDAESDVIRDSVNRRLNSTIKSRLNSRETPIIMIMQRLHDDDPAGFALDGGTGEEWEHLCLRALDENNEVLWELKHNREELETMRKADKYVFASQYQQTPVPDDGEYFVRSKAQYYLDIPQGLNYYVSGDFAVTEGGGDYTEIGVFGVSANDEIFVMD